MFTLIDRTVRVSPNASTSQFSQCPAKVYDAWIARVHANKTHVNAGDQYLWLYIQALPPKIVNCIITVQAGDEYPPS